MITLKKIALTIFICLSAVLQLTAYEVFIRREFNGYSIQVHGNITNILKYPMEVRTSFAAYAPEDYSHGTKLLETKTVVHIKPGEADVPIIGNATTPKLLDFSWVLEIAAATIADEIVEQSAVKIFYKVLIYDERYFRVEISDIPEKRIDIYMLPLPIRRS